MSAAKGVQSSAPGAESEPTLLSEIAAAAGLHKESVKMSYLIVAAPDVEWPDPPPGRLFRIVSEPLQGKGRLRYMGCGPEGRKGLALQEKHQSDTNGDFVQLARGDVVTLTELEARGDGVALSPQSIVRKL